MFDKETEHQEIIPDASCACGHKFGAHSFANCSCGNMNLTNCLTIKDYRSEIRQEKDEKGIIKEKFVVTELIWCDCKEYKEIWNHYDRDIR